MDCSPNYPQHYCTTRSQEERGRDVKSKCQHMYRTQGFDWKASQEAQPNSKREYEPGATTLYGLYAHQLPLCRQGAACVGSGAASREYPDCCYIGRFDGPRPPLARSP